MSFAAFAFLILVVVLGSSVVAFLFRFIPHDPSEADTSPDRFLNSDRMT